MSPSDQHIADLADDFVHDLLGAGRAADVERHCPDCPACKAAVDDARRRLAALQAEPAMEASEELVQKTLGKVDVHRKNRKRRWRLFLGAAGGALAASVVVLVSMHVYYFNLTATPYDLVVLGQRDLLAATNGSLRVVLRDHATLAPITGVPVQLQLIHADGRTADLASFTTDADGSGEPRFTLPDWPDGPCNLRVVAQTPGAPETSVQGVRLMRSFQVMLSSDKPVYQPGQTIHLRALALRRPDRHPVAGEDATYSVVDPRGNIVFKQGGKTSKYGISVADCPLDAEIQEGAYTVVCKTGDVESRLAVEVKKYVLPKFKATVTTDKPFYKPGETIKLTVQADYFFGKPVTESAVDVEVLNDAAGQAPTRLTGRTDGKGAVSFDYAVPPDANRQASAVSRIHFQVAVVDPAGQKQTASADAPVSESPAQIQVIPEAGELVQGPNTIYVLVTRLDGTPAQHAHLALFDLNKPHAEDKPSIPELADADEDGAAAFSIAPIPEPTHFGWQASLKVVAHDDLGMEIADCLANVRCGSTDDFLVRTDKAVYKAGDTMTLTAVGGHSGAVFVDLIKDGQTLRTETIEMANGQGQAAVDLAPDLAGTLQIVAYRLDKDGKPKRKARIVYVRPADDIHIAATLDPAKKEYRPGDSTQLHLQLTDKSGNPCPGAVSLAGVDEAVFSMLPQRPGTETAFYTLNEDLMAPVNRIHPWSPDVNASQRYEQALFAAASSVDETVQDHRNVPVLIDKKTMAPVDATHSLVAQTYEAKVQETAALRADRLRLMPQLWVAFIAAVIVTGFLGFWLFSQASILNKSVASVSILLPCTFYALIALQFTGQMGGKTQKDRINLVSGRQIFRDTNGVMPMEGAFGEVSMNQGFARVVDIKTLLDPARPQQGAPSPPRIRELFPETLLWRPEIVTDDEGHAALPLELADSITTWRLSASAVAADGKLGAAQLPVKVFRDFFVDLNLPVALTRGDEVGVPIVVYNYLDKPQTVALTLADDHDGWFTRLDGAEQRLDLGPNEVRSVHYRLKVEKVGDWTLTVAARGAADSDAVKRPIEVLPDGRRVEEVVNGVLEKPADVSLTVPENCIPGSAKEFVKIYPSTFSQVMEGLDGVFRMPNGCFEQTSSMTYPNVLALDYLQRTGQNRPAVRAKAEGYIRSGYQRLVGFEVLDDRGRPSGGFDWFGHAPANRALTAYGLMEFTDMARVQDVDPKLIARTRSWLLAQRQVDGSWDPETHRMHDDAVGGDPADARPAETAYVAWAVFGDRAAASDAFVTLNYLKSRISESIHDPHVLALVCNALLTVDAHNADAIPYLNRLESLKKFSDDGKFAWWEQPAGARTTFYGAGRGGEVETTALATLALIRAGRNPDTTRKTLTWITSQKDPNGTWYSTQATVLALKALLAGTGKPLGGDAERVVQLRLDGDLIDTVRIPADQAEVLKQVDLSPRLKPGKQVLTIAEANGAAIGFQSSFRCNVPDAARPPAALAVDLTYDRTTLAVDEQVEATATVRFADPQESGPMVMVELPIPPGFVPSADEFTALVKPGGGAAKVQMQPRSVLVYLTGLDRGERWTVRYHLRATMPVQAAAGGARAYEYYDPDKQGSSAGTRFTVTAQQ